MAFLRAALAVLLLAGVCHAQAQPKTAAPKATVPAAAAAAPAAGDFPTAWDALTATPSLSKFAHALEVAGLKPYLSTKVTRATIFAPTNAALEKAAASLKLKLPADLEKPVNAMLVDRLAGYHTITGADITAAKITSGPVKTAYANHSLDVTTSASGVTVKGAQNSAKVTTPDIRGGNVVIHVIDTVLLPNTVFTSIKDALAFAPATKTLSALIAKDPKLAMAAADPTTNVTLFAPISSALDALAATPEGKKIVSDPAALNKVLSYHIVKGARVEPVFSGGHVQELPTLLAGQSVTVSKVISPKAEGHIGKVTVTADSKGAEPVTVGKFNIIAGASFINVIDGVLVPSL